LPLSDHAARGLCHLLLVAGLAQQGAGVVAAGVQAPGTSAVCPPSGTCCTPMHSGQAPSVRAQLDLAPKLLLE